MEYLQMIEEWTISWMKPQRKLVGMSICNLEARHTYKRRQLGSIICKGFSEDCFGDLAYLDLKKHSQAIDTARVHMELLKVIYHDVTACYVYMYIGFLHVQVMIVYIACVILPVLQNDSIESIPVSEPEAGNPVVCQDEVWEQHSMVCRENCKTGDSEDRVISVQTADIKGEVIINISSNDLSWTCLNGACNIPLLICGKLLYLPYTAMLDSRIPHLYDAIVRPIVLHLSANDLNKLFTLFIQRFKDRKYYGSLLNKTGRCQNELKCCGSGSADVDVNKKCSVKEIYQKDRTKNKEENKISHEKFDKESIGGRVNPTFVNKASRTKPGLCPSLNTGSHNAPSKKQLVCVMLILLLLVVPTKQNPIRDKGEAISTDSAVFHNFPLLKSWCPNPEKNTECPGKDRIFEYKTDSCEYKCLSWEDVKCMDSKFGAVYFCVPKNTTCAKGVGWQIEGVEQNVDDPSESNVVVKESVCAEGFYQAVPSKCLNACRTRHETLALIPEGFRMASKGDHTHPTTLMCDYPAGYYNAHNKSIVNFDRSISLHYGFCTHINVSNPCSTGQMPLYNGTCVDLCGQGFKRDETDFRCREVSSPVETTGNHTTSRQPSATSTSSPTDTSETNTQRDKGHDGDIDNSDGVNGKPEKSDWYFKGLMIFGAVVVVAILVIVGVFTKMICCPKNSQELACTYQAVFYRCSDRDGSNRSSASCIEGGQSTTDESTADVNEYPDDAKGTAKVEIQSSSNCLNGGPDVTVSSQKAIAGEEFAKERNELLSQDIVSNASEYMKSVGALIYKGDVAGTVFRAGDSFVFTALHVIKNIIDVNRNGQLEASLLETEHVWINFNSSIAQPARIVYRVCLEFASNDPKLDFAVLRITNPVQLPKKMFLYKYKFERLQVRKLSGVGYGHPDPDSKCKKNLDPNCEIIFAIENRIAACVDWLQDKIPYYRNHVRQNGANPALVDNNSYTGIDTQHNILLDITMEHGGSGSPFFDNEGRVLGILTHGHPEFCFKLPVIIRSLFPKNKRFESVLRLDYVYQHIFFWDAELASKLFGETVDQV